LIVSKVIFFKFIHFKNTISIQTGNIYLVNNRVLLATKTKMALTTAHLNIHTVTQLRSKNLTEQ